MLSLFPALLSYKLLAFALLRISAGLVFLYLAYFHYTNRRKATQELSLFVGSASVICVLYALVELLVAVSLIAGAWTQLGALLGALIACKVLLIRRSLHELRPLSSLSYALLAVICFCLVVTGAGIFAFDLPL